MDNTFTTPPGLLRSEQIARRSLSYSAKALPRAPEITAPQVEPMHYIPTAHQISARLVAIRARVQQAEEAE